MKDDFPPEVRQGQCLSENQSRSQGVAQRYQKKSKRFICLRQGGSSFESSGIDHTAAASGIGRAVARSRMAGERNDRCGRGGLRARARRSRVRAEIVEAGGTAAALSLDVTMAREVKAAVGDGRRNASGRIDVLAAHRRRQFYPPSASRISPGPRWKLVIDTSATKGTFLMCREVAPIMQKQKSGRILNTASELRRHRFSAARCSYSCC